MTPFDITTSTPQQIVDRVAERLRDGRGRCASGEACQYYRAADGNMCAVGYLLPDPMVLKDSVATVFNLTDGGYSTRLGEPVVAALSRHETLLQSLQELHDNHSNWVRGGYITHELNAFGEQYLARICHAHGLTYPEKKETTDAEVRS